MEFRIARKFDTSRKRAHPTLPVLLTEPQPTAYDLKFNLGPVPVRVHPLFWLMGILLSGGGRPEGVFEWVLVIFVSILVHEMGHAVMMMRYGSRARVSLYMMGGLAIPDRPARTPLQSFIVSFAGPAAGFVLAAVILLLARLTGCTIGFTPIFNVIPFWYIVPGPDTPGLYGEFLNDMMFVNIFWGLVNLLPIYPLDGGQMARTVFEKYDLSDGTRKSLWISLVFAVAVTLAGLVYLQSIFVALLFGSLAYGSWQGLQMYRGGHVRR